MSLLFLETSALAKLYIRELGTDFMVAQAHPDAGNRLAILSVALVELRSALRARQRRGNITANDTQSLLDAFRQHLADLFIVQPVNDTVIERALPLVDRHHLRAYDALQLAGYLTIRDMVGEETGGQFLCSDLELIEAALREGVTVVDPTERTA